MVDYKMESCVLEANVCGCGPPETRVWFFLGGNLKTALDYAKKGEFVRGSSTEDVCDFFLKAETKGREELSRLPLVLSKDIYCVTKAVGSMDFSIKINDYFLHEQGIEMMDEFYDKYLSFVTACRKVTRNILKAPKVRLNWNSESMKQNVKLYGDFVEYLIEKADHEDAIKSWDRSLWNRYIITSLP